MAGLLSTRRGALTLAVVCALVATGILMFAMSKYRHAVSDGAKQSTVLVASAVSPKGMAGDAIASKRLYRVVPVLATQMAAGAIVNAAALTGEHASSEILPGQQLTSSDFTATATTGGGAINTQLTPTERGVAVTLDPAHGTGVLQAGDHVDVYSGYAGVISLLVPDAVVLKAPSAASGGAGASSSGTVLLGVNMALAPRVMWAFDNGKVWLELRGVVSSDANPTVTGLRQTLLGNYLSSTPTYAAPATTGAKR
jgi:Flp pilus assembly protein CpaB